MKPILILGGGVGGVVTANELRKKIGKQHKIIVFDKDDKHVFAPSLLWLMTGLRKPEKISRELNRCRRSKCLSRAFTGMQARYCLKRTFCGGGSD